MSLLLDALKKAAEQKAEKSRQEAPAASPSDETVITPAAEDTAALATGADNSAQSSQRDVDDETQLDTSELQTRLESNRVEPKVSDDTDLEIPDSTRTQTPSPSSQMQTGEDETIIFDNEDVSEFLGEPELVRRKPQDETDLSQLVSDETDLSEVMPQREASGSPEVTADEDDTDISRPLQPGDQTDVREPIATGDDTDISQHGPQAESASQQEESVTAELTNPDQGDDVESTEVAADEDISLVLIDRDDTNLTSPGLVTDRPAPSSNPPATESDEDDTEGLALVDTTQHQAPDDITETSVPTRSSTTATTGIANQTQTQGVTTRMEATSTRTYAPDNYDRTLMKLPSDDASKIFAGMKSDNDVVMTPDYAKKVFRSKSSAQRLQAVKVYSGIVVVILLSIAIFGTFEFQEQSNDIEMSLRPLKRDPMPGIIQPDKSVADSDLFTGAEVDSRTIEMIAGADDDSEMVVEEVVNTEASVVAAEGVIAGQPETTDEAVIAENVVAEDNAAADVDSVAPEQGESVATTQVASIDSEEAATAQPEDNTTTLKIITSSQIEQKDLWLREAYAAYKSGNESLALTRYNQVLEVDPGNRNALLARAAINVQNNNSDAAIRDYRTLLLHNPKDSLAMSSFIAVANLSPRETESQLKLMIRDEPDSPYLNFALANAYGAQQRWQEAQGYYFKALEYNPSDPNYAYNLAVSLEHIAQPRAAILYYQRALKNFGNSLATFNRDIVSQRVEILAKK